MLAFRRLFLICALLGGIEADCDLLWQRFGDSCYVAYSGSDSWHSARKYCMEDGGDLASILTEQEQAFVLKLAIDTGSATWIGLNQLGDRLTLQWSDGSAVGFTSWLPQFPHNDQLHLCTFIRSAAPLHKGQAGTWQTENCGVGKGFVCKKPADATGPVTPAPTPIIPGYCPTGYYGTGNKCFKVVRPINGQTVNWTRALDICRSEPGRLADLASINSEEEQNIIIAQLRDIEAGMWIGMHMWNGDKDNNWLWVDNSEKTFENWEFSDPGESDDWCVEMATWEAGLWNNAPCSALRGYVCQTYKDEQAVITTPPPTPFICPPGYVAYWYACYKFVATPATWVQADEVCRNDSGHLVSIHSEPENAAVFTAARGQLPTWLGFKQDPISKDFVWSDGSQEYYTNWAYAGSTGGDSAILTDDETWRAVSGTMTLHSYVCKIYSAVTTATTPVHIDGTCPNKDWVAWGSHCYYFTKSTDSVTSWSSAKATCTAKAGISFVGSVASIHSDAENRFIYNYIVDAGDTHSDVWIGLTQNNASAPYKWADGTDVQFTQWAVDEPSSSAQVQCGVMHVEKWPGHWYDHPCSGTSVTQAVCKTPKEPSTATTTVSATTATTSSTSSAPASTSSPTTVTSSTTAPSSTTATTVTSSSSTSTLSSTTVNLPDTTSMPNSSTMPLTTPAPGPNSCQTGEWILYGNTCFLFRTTASAYSDWDTARQTCESEGGEGSTLATIHDYTENWFLWQKLYDHNQYASSYIGLYRENASSGFKWLDGSAVNYVNWNIGEPNNNDTHHCVVIFHSNGEWNTVHCNEVTSFICRVSATAAISAEGVTGGQVAGTVIGVLLGTVLVALLVMITYRNRADVRKHLDRLLLLNPRNKRHTSSHKYKDFDSSSLSGVSVSSDQSTYRDGFSSDPNVTIRTQNGVNSIAYTSGSSGAIYNPNITNNGSSHNPNGIAHSELQPDFNFISFDDNIFNKSTPELKLSYSLA